MLYPVGIACEVVDQPVLEQRRGVRLGTVVAVCALMLLFRKQITKAVKILRK